MIAIPDTNVLIWLFRDDPRLSRRALSVLDDSQVALALPIIVAGELHDLFRRGKLQHDLTEVLLRLRAGRRCEVLPMTEETLSFVPDGLDIHDSWIAATALYLQQEQPGETFLILTSDLQLRELSGINTIW